MRNISTYQIILPFRAIDNLFVLNGKVTLFFNMQMIWLLARMGLIFVTAGEVIAVACGSAKAPNLPERAKLLCVFVLPFRAGDNCCN
jgi:ABC-type transport system involved in cytochrome c biogenesis permease component